MEVKPGYKQTEVGVIPEEWDVQPLKGNLDSHSLVLHQPMTSRVMDIPPCPRPDTSTKNRGFRDDRR